MKCIYCHRDITKCKMDKRGLCIKDPKSDGKAKPRTRTEKNYDKRTRPGLAK